MMIPVCENNTQLQDRLARISVMASVVRYKADKINNRIRQAQVQYNPMSMRSVGYMTRELDDMNSLIYQMNALVESI